ncbi:MAG: alkaline phosphatase, partial [Bacteroidota bacterium]
MSRRYILLIFGFLLAFSACPPVPPPVTENEVSNVEIEQVTSNHIPATEPEVEQKPKNIILMIGDGMGISQITAGLYSNSNTLELERFSVIGLHKSYSSDNLVTD